MSEHISILYPIRDDFLNFNERQCPQLFNYVCLHGCQLFLTNVNKQYEVVTSGWIPKDCVDKLTNLEKIKNYHCLLRTKEYEIAYYRFIKFAVELLEKTRYTSQLELF